MKTRLKEQYESVIRPQLQKELGLSNIMSVPKLHKITLNVGVGRDIGDNKVRKVVLEVLSRIAGQKPVVTKARKSIAGFKIRAGMPLGAKVTLRGNHMYEFLDRLINIALPKVRDLQGVSREFDKDANYNLGIKEWTIFPEVDYEISDKVYGLSISVGTSTKNKEHALKLLEGFGMPFKRA